MTILALKKTKPTQTTSCSGKLTLVTWSKVNVTIVFFMVASKYGCLQSAPTLFGFRLKLGFSLLVSHCLAP